MGAKKKNKIITARNAGNTSQLRQFINKDKFINLYSQDEVRSNISMCCDTLEINRQSYYNWLENDENYWSCFAGCGGGTIIDFWMRWSALDFR